MTEYDSDSCSKIHYSGSKEYCVGPCAGRTAPILDQDDLRLRCRTPHHRLCPRLSRQVQSEPASSRPGSK